MSTSTTSVDCPNCGVSAATGLCDRTTGSVGPEAFDDVVCRVCDRNRSHVRRDLGYDGDRLAPDEVEARARKELRAFGLPDAEIGALRLLASAGPA